MRAAGLVQLKPLRGPDLPLLTQKLIQKYISDGDTGAVISVISATVPEVQNAPIFRILAELPEELKSNCIGVFAKTDMSLSQDHGLVLCDASDIRHCLTRPSNSNGPCFKVQASAPSPVFNAQLSSHFVFLQNWLQQVMNPSTNRNFQAIADTFRAGCVALVNRSTTHDVNPDTSISDQVSRESEFFLRRSGMSAFFSFASAAPSPLPPLQSAGSAPDSDAHVTLNEVGFRCLGIGALMSRIDIIIR